MSAKSLESIMESSANITFILLKVPISRSGSYYGIVCPLLDIMDPRSMCVQVCKLFEDSLRHFLFNCRVVVDYCKLVEQNLSIQFTSFDLRNQGAWLEEGEHLPKQEPWQL